MSAEPASGAVLALGDVIAEARDECPRLPDDMDSWDLAYVVLAFLAENPEHVGLDPHMVETLRLRTAALHRVSRSNDLLRRENDDLRARLAEAKEAIQWLAQRQS